MARFEANRFRSPIIEVEHLLLGFLRADVALAVRVFGSRAKVEEIRERVERETPQRNEATSTSVDIPLSGESKDALTRATEEASRLGRDQVAAEHLLLGI